MATTTVDRNEICPLYRIELKTNAHLAVWQISSESGHTYNVSLLDGKVSGCETTTGEPCKGWKFYHKCHHASLAQRKEDERKAQAEPRRNYAALNGTREFSLLK